MNIPQQQTPIISTIMNFSVLKIQTNPKSHLLSELHILWLDFKFYNLRWLNHQGEDTKIDLQKTEPDKSSKMYQKP